MERSQRERYIPTPEEIRIECAKIRDGWSEERWSRQTGPTPWYPPVAVMPKKYA
jgi:hypothetical protein